MNARHSELQALAGAQVVSVQLDDEAWKISFTNGFVLTVECLWRLAVEGVLIRTSEDHLQMFGGSTFVDAAWELEHQTKDLSISSVTFAPGTADLRVEFDLSTVLEIISMSAGYENWHVMLPDGRDLHSVA